MTRIENLREKLPKGFGAAIIIDGNNRYYFTEFRSSAGALVVTQDSSYFFTDFRYSEVAKSTVKGSEVAMAENLAKDVAKLVAEKGIKNVMMENCITVATADDYKKELGEGVVVDLTKTLTKATEECRMIKEDSELALMQKAQDISDDAFEYTLKQIKVGMSEREIMLILEGKMRELGAQDIAFDSIVVSGEKGSLPHGVPGERKVQKGDMITFDFGAKYNGYCTDITRTIAIGEISDEQREIYEIVKEAQQAGVDALKEGANGKALDKIARDIITDKGYGDYFGHGLGHSLGLYVHEEPRLSKISDAVMAAGMVVTVEPGIYLPGKYGVRIEDSCIVAKDGCRPLSRITKELITIEG